MSPEQATAVARPTGRNFAIHRSSHFTHRAAGDRPQLPLQPQGVLSTHGGREIDLEQPDQALVQAGASHSPQRTFEQASIMAATGQQGRREVAPARQFQHGRPSSCRRKQWRRSWGSQSAAAGLPVRALPNSHLDESLRQSACSATAAHGSIGTLVAESTTRATYGQVAIQPGSRTGR